jgi:hypothetical protein
VNAWRPGSEPAPGSFEGNAPLRGVAVSVPRERRRDGDAGGRVELIDVDFSGFCDSTFPRLTYAIKYAVDHGIAVVIEFHTPTGKAHPIMRGQIEDIREPIPGRPSQPLSEEAQAEEDRCNYERYRDLIRLAKKGVADDERVAAPE